MSWVASVTALSPSIIVDRWACSVTDRLGRGRRDQKPGRGGGPTLRGEGCGKTAHPRRPRRFHHSAPDEKRVAGLQQAAECLEEGKTPQHHRDLLLVALPRTAVEDFNVQVGQASRGTGFIIRALVQVSLCVCCGVTLGRAPFLRLKLREASHRAARTRHSTGWGFAGCSP